MFVLQEILRVRNTRQSEAVKRLNWIHGLMQPQPGFVGATVSRYLGNPTDYLILRAFESGDAYRAFRHTNVSADLELDLRVGEPSGLMKPAARFVDPQPCRCERGVVPERVGGRGFDGQADFSRQSGRGKNEENEVKAEHGMRT